METHTIFAYRFWIGYTRIRGGNNAWPVSLTSRLISNGQAMGGDKVATSNNSLRPENVITYADTHHINTITSTTDLITKH